ncbi:MAG: hypothetical protein M3046_08240, partial [Actinomycetota bacterium]|nr:hypothetical protein [Actinomycetota bacterium]
INDFLPEALEVVTAVAIDPHGQAVAARDLCRYRCEAGFADAAFTKDHPVLAGPLDGIHHPDEFAGST